MPNQLLQRLKLLFLLCCGLGIAALSGWGSFAYRAGSAQGLSVQLSSVVGERKAVTAQRDEAVDKLKRLQQSVGNLGQVEAKLSVARAEYNRFLELTKAMSQASATKEQMAELVKRVQQAKDVDFMPTGSIRTAEPPRRRAP